MSLKQFVLSIIIYEYQNTHIKTKIRGMLVIGMLYTQPIGIMFEEVNVMYVSNFNLMINY